MPVHKPESSPITGGDPEDPGMRRSARLTKALGHPVRLAILKLLSERDSCFCGDFTDVFPLAQSTIPNI